MLDMQAVGASVGRNLEDEGKCECGEEEKGRKVGKEVTRVAA